MNVSGLVPSSELATLWDLGISLWNLETTNEWVSDPDLLDSTPSSQGSSTSALHPGSLLPDLATGCHCGSSNWRHLTALPFTPSFLFFSKLLTKPKSALSIQVTGKYLGLFWCQSHVVLFLMEYDQKLSSHCVLKRRLCWDASEMVLHGKDRYILWSYWISFSPFTRSVS